MRGIIAELRSLQNQLCLSILSEACSSYFPENEFIILTTIVDIGAAGDIITTPVDVLPFSRSPVLPFSRSPVLPFSRSPVLPFSRSPVTRG